MQGMRSSITGRGIRGVLFALLMISVLTVPVAATVSITGNATYEGVDNEEDQAITVETTISPDGAEMVDTRLSFTGTDQTFLEADSFDRSISPGDADINVTSVGDGQFEVNRIGPDEEVTFTYEVYPKTISEESIDASRVVIEYTQSGQELRDSQTFSADLTNSSWFKLNEQQQLTGAIGIVNIGSYLLNLVLLGIGVVLVYRVIIQDKPEV